MQIEPTWWISVIEVPIAAALFWMINGLRQDLQTRIERSDHRENEAVGRTRDELAEFKLEVARTYVPLQGLLMRLISLHFCMLRRYQPTNGPPEQWA